MKNTLGNTIGAALLGAFASAILFGIAVVQVYIYYKNYSKDWIFQKVAVALLLLLDILHAGFTILTIYQYLIDSFGDLNALQYISWAFKSQVAFNAVIILVVQGLYAWRVWRLASKFSMIWPCLIILLVASGWGLGIVITIKTCERDNFATAHEFESVIKASFIAATIIDFAIAISICYYLQSGRTTFSSGTNNILVKIMRYVLVCGFLTSTCSLAVLITHITMPLNLIYVGIDLLLPHLYINSYLALLNARNGYEERVSSFNVSDLKFQTRKTVQSESANVEEKNYQRDSDGFSPTIYHHGPFSSGTIDDGHFLKPTITDRNSHRNPQNSV